MRFSAAAAAEGTGHLKRLLLILGGPDGIPDQVRESMRQTLAPWWMAVSEGWSGMHLGLVSVVGSFFKRTYFVLCVDQYVPYQYIYRYHVSKKTCCQMPLSGLRVMLCAQMWPKEQYTDFPLLGLALPGGTLHSYYALATAWGPNDGYKQIKQTKHNNITIN